MTTIEFAESAWALCSAMFALFLAATCALALMSVLKMLFNLLSHWVKRKKGDSNE